MRSLGAPLWGESGGVLIPLMATPSWHSVHVGAPSLPSHMSIWGRRVCRGPWLFQDAARGKEGKAGEGRLEQGPGRQGLWAGGSETQRGPRGA